MLITCLASAVVDQPVVIASVASHRSAALTVFVPFALASFTCLSPFFSHKVKRV